MLQHSATHCNSLQLTATHCNSLQHSATHWQLVLSKGRCVTHCNTLQHTATRCNALQLTATHCNTLQHTATHCHTLQHTATHCHTLQHTKDICNAEFWIKCYVYASWLWVQHNSTGFARLVWGDVLAWCTRPISHRMPLVAGHFSQQSHWL